MDVVIEFKAFAWCFRKSLEEGGWRGGGRGEREVLRCSGWTAGLRCLDTSHLLKHTTRFLSLHKTIPQSLEENMRGERRQR